MADNKSEFTIYDNTDTKNEIDKLPIEKYTVIPVANKAFQKLENN